ncbi:hypothetical protein P170DRAFT_265778 [Aspergillus steynii IBT 23096]|uniref:Uncharacterized protein n=1 Tax=Aspergillus steynii IBT 23096 TaxID=1392250 RepID=A0A2I2FVT0_9EURO|nr:uncharacterized protein P170DRAFT_265778 [Aspergillus steynii IBT 23096]PLB44727.1 hypothetical protein P170DRAFT_265778 [Aspergillus steynii IBT 23096]
MTNCLILRWRFPPSPIRSLPIGLLRLPIHAGCRTSGYRGRHVSDLYLASTDPTCPASDTTQSREHAVRIAGPSIVSLPSPLICPSRTCVCHDSPVTISILPPRNTVVDAQCLPRRKIIGPCLVGDPNTAVHTHFPLTRQTVSILASGLAPSVFAMGINSFSPTDRTAFRLTSPEGAGCSAFLTRRLLFLGVYVT